MTVQSNNLTHGCMQEELASRDFGPEGDGIIADACQGIFPHQPD